MTGILSWLVGHEAVLAGLVVSVVDFVFSVSPNSQANSFLEWLLAQAKALVGGAHDMTQLKKPKM